MKAADIKTKSSSELQDMVVQLKREILDLRFQRVNGQLTNPSRFRMAKREIARIKTVLNQTVNKNG